MKSSFLHAAFVCSLLVVGAQAQAGILGLVVNGDFEDDPLSANPLDLPIPGWRDIGDTTFDDIELSHQHSGSQAAYFGPFSPNPVGPVGGIEQDLSTTPGASYLLTFWLRNDAGDVLSRQPQTFFSVDWGATQLTQLSHVNSFEYADSPNPFSFAVTATGSTTTLRFQFQNNDGFFDLDDVSVIPLDVNAASEPVSLTIWSLGALAVVLAGRCRMRIARRSASAPKNDIASAC